MEPTQPRTVVHSGVAPTVRARASLVRAMRNLDDWERAYLSGQADQRGAAYLALRANVDAAKAAMTEALGGVVRQGRPVHPGQHETWCSGDCHRALVHCNADVAAACYRAQRRHELAPADVPPGLTESELHALDGNR